MRRGTGMCAVAEGGDDETGGGGPSPEGSEAVGGTAAADDAEDDAVDTYARCTTPLPGGRSAPGPSTASSPTPTPTATMTEEASRTRTRRTSPSTPVLCVPSCRSLLALRLGACTALRYFVPLLLLSLRGDGDKALPPRAEKRTSP